MVGALSVDVFTGGAKVSVSEELCEELAARLERFAAADAAARLRKRERLLETDKPVIGEVLGRWRRQVKAGPLAEELWRLQVELGKGRGDGVPAWGRDQGESG